MSQTPPPTLEDVFSFVREFAGLKPTHQLAVKTRLDADIGVTGDDGQALLERAATTFEARLASTDDGYRSTFMLGENECLFHAEGLDLIGVGSLMRWIMRKPRPIVRDLTIGELHSAILRTRRA